MLCTSFKVEFDASPFPLSATASSRFFPAPTPLLALSILFTPDASQQSDIKDDVDDWHSGTVVNRYERSAFF